MAKVEKNPTAAAKKAKIAAAVKEKYVIVKEPVRCEPDTLGYNPNNRRRQDVFNLLFFHNLGGIKFENLFRIVLEPFSNRFRTTLLLIFKF